MSINDLNPSQAGADEQADDLPQVDELTMLKQRATLMGVKFSNNIGLDALKKKIEDHQSGEASAEAEAEVAAPAVNPLAQAGEDTAAAEAQVAKPKTLRQMLMEEQMKLVRIRVQNLDPKKKDMPGEVFTVANEYIGTVRKYVPYGEATDGGYHVPFCIYQMLKDRKFLNIRTGKDRRGQVKVEQGWAREFSIEVLEPLTTQELHTLAQAQIAAGSTESD
jgi:hypothetical protein